MQAARKGRFGCESSRSTPGKRGKKTAAGLILSRKFRVATKHLSFQLTSE